MATYLMILIRIGPLNCLMAQKPDLPIGWQQVEQAVCDLSFGNRQVEQVISDRPDMGSTINREPVLRMMLTWYFAGEVKGYRVHWDCREPPNDHPACHLPPLSDYPVLVRVSSKWSAADKCAMLLFELQNLAIDKEYQLLIESAAEDRKSRDEFARSCVEHEFKASKKTQLFFMMHPIVGANYKNSPYYSLLIVQSGDYSDYLRWLDTLDSKTYNPLKYYGLAYDGMTSSRKR